MGAVGGAFVVCADHEREILRTVVVSDRVLVMHELAWQQRTTQLSLHHDAMLRANPIVHAPGAHVQDDIAVTALRAKKTGRVLAHEDSIDDEGPL